MENGTLRIAFLEGKIEGMSEMLKFYQEENEKLKKELYESKGFNSSIKA